MNPSIDTGIWNAILQASPIVQVTFLLLVGLSVFCWAVGISKFREFSKIRRANPAFLDRFWKTSSFDSLHEDMELFPHSTVARVFQAGFLEMQRLAQKNSGAQTEMQLSGLDNLERTLKKAVDVEIDQMESRLTLLATTGSTGPFIGLFGTVWGIMGSFHKIGASGSASLAVVAPGISEALFATAIGLAAAIPAVVMYNQFIARIRKSEIELNNFAADFLNIAKRNFFKE